MKKIKKINQLISLMSLCAPFLAFAASPEVDLGFKLYMDPRLSVDGSISCNSCHNVMAGGDDQRSTSIGVKGQIGGRNAPSVWNSRFYSVQFWDGRAKNLEEQAKGPLVNPGEMGNKDHSVVVDRIASIPGYVSEFKKVYPKEPKITIDLVAKSIAAFEKTLVTGPSPYDEFMKGKKSALSKSAQNGMKLVETVGCMSCHSGPQFAGPTLPEGTGFYQKFPMYEGSAFDKKYDLLADKGRGAHTGNKAENHFFKVQTWRNVAMTAPYFHNGKVKTLDEAVRVMAKTQLNKDLTDSEVTDIVAFLESMTGKYPKLEMPRLPATSGTTAVQNW